MLLCELLVDDIQINISIKHVKPINP